MTVKEALSKTKMAAKLASDFCVRHTKACVCAFFALVFVFGFISAFDYGINYDSPSEHEITMVNVKYIGEKLLGEHSYSEHSYFRNVPSLENYKERDHGKAMFYPYAVFKELVRPSAPTLRTSMNVYTFCVNFIGIVFLYLVAVRLLKRRKYGILAVLLWLASPRIFADTIYNEKDMVFAGLVMASVYFSIRVLEKPNLRDAVFLGVSAAFACNARILGLAFPALALIYYIIKLIQGREWKLKAILPILVALLTCFAVFCLITPATWISITDYFTYTFTSSADFSRWNGYVRYFGVLYNNVSNPLPWHYLPMMILMTTPILICAAISFGIFAFWRYKRKEGQAWFVLLQIFVVLPIAFVIINGSNIYNGWRHFYFLFPPMLLIALYGIKYLLEPKPKAVIFNRRSIAVGLIVLQLTSSLVWGAVNHPYEYVFFNLPFKWAAKECDLDYWNLSAYDALSTCTEKEKGSFVISAGDTHSDYALSTAYFCLDEGTQNRITVLPYTHAKEAEYLLINPFYYNEMQELGKKYTPIDFSKYTVLKQIKVDGNVIMSVYKKL
jgi:hypothetical protein